MPSLLTSLSEAALYERHILRSKDLVQVLPDKGQQSIAFGRQIVHFEETLPVTDCSAHELYTPGVTPAVACTIIVLSRYLHGQNVCGIFAA